MDKTPAFPRMLTRFSKFRKAKDTTKFIFFVIPPGQSMENCLHSKIGEVYEASKAHALNVKWIEDDQCKDQQLYSNLNIFVFDPFGGPGFRYCVEKLSTFKSGDPKVEIFGPMVLQATFNELPRVKTIEHRGSPVHNLALEGITVCITDVKEDHNKVVLEKLIRMMNGEISIDLTKFVNYVITGTALSTLCMTARDNRIPVKTLEWIPQLWVDNQSNYVPPSDGRYSSFDCPMFYNIQIYISELPQQDIQDLKRPIRILGGILNETFIRGKIDLLVVDNAGGQKFKAAEDFHAICTTQHWIRESIETGFLLPPADFYPPPLPSSDATWHVPPSSPSNSNMATSGFSAVTERVLAENSELASYRALVSATDSEYTLDSAGISDISKVPSSSTNSKSGLFLGITFEVKLLNEENRKDVEQEVVANGGTVTEDHADITILEPICKKIKHDSGKKFVTKYWLLDCISEKSVDISQTFSHIPLRSFRNMEKLFTGVVLSVTGFTDGERDYIQTVVDALGGKFQLGFATKDSEKLEISKSTHLVSKTSCNIKAKAARKSKVPIVVVDWVLESFMQRSRLDEEMYDPDQISSSADATYLMCSFEEPKSALNQVEPHQESNSLSLEEWTSDDNIELDDGLVTTNSPEAKRTDLFVKLPDLPIFLLSSLDYTQRKTATEAVIKLGGLISAVAPFDPECHAMVTGVLSKTEKVLCCIASGKFILKPEYLNESSAAGNFLPIEKKFLWSEVDTKSDIERMLAQASLGWLEIQMSQPGKRPMTGMKFFVSKEREVFERFIRACGGVVVTDVLDCKFILANENCEVPDGVSVITPVDLANLVLTVPKL